MTKEQISPTTAPSLPASNEGDSIFDLARPVEQKPEPRDQHRFYFSMILILVFCAEIVAALGVVIFWPDRVKAVSEILNVLISPTVAILGTIIGFYFGTQIVTR